MRGLFALLGIDRFLFFGLLWRTFPLAFKVLYALKSVLFDWVVAVPVSEHLVQLLWSRNVFQTRIVVVFHKLTFQRFSEHLGTYSFVLRIKGFIEYPALQLVYVPQPSRIHHHLLLSSVVKETLPLLEFRWV